MRHPLESTETATVLNALDCLRVGVAVFDPADVLVYCNEHYRYVYRSFASVDELIGLKFAEIVRLKAENGDIAGKQVIDDREAWIEARLGHHRAARGHCFEQQLSDGSWVEIKERPTRDGGVIGLWTDVTERKVTEARLAAAMENAGDGFAVWDQADRLVLYNDRFAQLHVSAEQRLRPGDRFAEVLRRTVEGGGIRLDSDPDAWVAEQVRRRRDPVSETVVEYEGERWFFIKERRMGDGGTATVFSDITELKKREQEVTQRGKTLQRTVNELEMVQVRLEKQGAQVVEMAEGLHQAKLEADQANHAKSDFLATMSHELRTPLNAIIGFSEIMVEGLFGPVGGAKYTEYVDDIHTSARHLLDLINDILDLSKIEAGRIELREETVDVDGAIDGCLALVKERVHAAGLTLEKRVADGLPALWADARMVRQILINLLSNAVKFTPSGGSVGVEAALSSTGALVLAVSDTGIGMAPEDIPKVMEPFVQVDGVLNRKYEGTGLGLPLASRLAEMHGADFELKSEEGVGTTVTIRFPAERMRVRAA